MSRNDLDSKYGNHQKGSQTNLRKMRQDTLGNSEYYDEEESRSFNVSPELKSKQKDLRDMN